MLINMSYCKINAFIRDEGYKKIKILKQKVKKV